MLRVHVMGQTEIQATGELFIMTRQVALGQSLLLPTASFHRRGMLAGSKLLKWPTRSLKVINTGAINRHTWFRFDMLAFQYRITIAILYHFQNITTYLYKRTEEVVSPWQWPLLDSHSYTSFTQSKDSKEAPKFTTRMVRVTKGHQQCSPIEKLHKISYSSFIVAISLVSEISQNADWKSQNFSPQRYCAQTGPRRVWA